MADTPKPSPTTIKRMLDMTRQSRWSEWVVQEAGSRRRMRFMAKLGDPPPVPYHLMGYTLIIQRVVIP